MLPPRELLLLLQKIEQQFGRDRSGEQVPNSPRPLDLDIILYGDLQLQEPDLVIPHPRYKERNFVLQPLAELDPRFIPLYEANRQREQLVICSTLEETEQLAEQLAPQLTDGLTIALNGELGAGKTAFTKALVRAKGSEALVTSPTFVLLNIYEGAFPFYHFDFYRLEQLSDLAEIGGLEFIPPQRGAAIIEWAENIPEAISTPLLNIDIAILDAEQRRFSLSWQR